MSSGPERLTKRYGDLRAVDGVNLEVRAGDVYGFLGANGSGKTTTVRMLLGLVLPTSGEAEVLGKPMPNARRSVLPRIGSLVESPAAYPHLSGSANLALLDATGSDRSRAARAPNQHRHRAGASWARPRRSPTGPHLLARHAPAARAGGRADAPTHAADLGRAEQWPRPARHPGDPRTTAAPERSRHHDLPLQPSCLQRSSRCVPTSACCVTGG